MNGVNAPEIFNTASAALKGVPSAKTSANLAAVGGPTLVFEMSNSVSPMPLTASRSGIIPLSVIGFDPQRSEFSAASALINLVTSAIPTAAMPQLDRSMEVNVFET
eukprot:COSAG05_NODE_15509_length_367_cov_14.876866_1_plen_105_part_10